MKSLLPSEIAYKSKVASCVGVCGSPVDREFCTVFSNMSSFYLVKPSTTVDALNRCVAEFQDLLDVEITKSIDRGQERLPTPLQYMGQMLVDARDRAAKDVEFLMILRDTAAKGGPDIPDSDRYQTLFQTIMARWGLDD